MKTNHVPKARPMRRINLSFPIPDYERLFNLWRSSDSGSKHLTLGGYVRSMVLEQAGREAKKEAKK